MSPRPKRRPKPLARIVGVVSVSLMLTNALPCLGEPCAWIFRGNSGPSPRQGAAMAYDAARRVIVLFGGYESGNGHRGDTWEWDGASWTLRSSSGPSARYWHAMSYDDTRGVTVLFGGSDASGNPVGDTWEWDGTAWAMRNEGGPSARLNSPIAYDSARGVTVLFGGYNGPSVFGDTWEWDGNEWSMRTGSGPSPRGAHAAAYDRARGVTVLFGGIDGTVGFVGDTWEWDGTGWTLRTNGGPPPRAAHAMAYDSTRGVTLLFGGSNDSGGAVNDTWEWNGATWNIQASVGPSPRYWHAMAFDGFHEVTALFGGSDGSPYSGETWAFGCAPAAATVGDDVCAGGSNVGELCGQHSDCPGGFCGSKNRFLSAGLPETAVGHGVKVDVVGIDAGSVASPGNYNGTVRWGGAPLTNIDDGVSPPFNASGLQCAFATQDWSALGLVHFYGDVVVPQSTYDMSVCSSATGPCSATLRVVTAKFGDIVAPVNNVNFQDVNSVVVKFQGGGTGPSKTRTKLANSTPDPASPINFQEVSACVSGFQGKAFKTVVTTAPATCP